jgi:hypothetical protein
MPMPTVWPSGVTVIETMVGAVTVTVVDCETAPRAAEILVLPAATAVRSPLALMVAVAVEVELQVTTEVRSALLPSL